LIHGVHVATTLVLALTGLYLSYPFLPPPLLRLSLVRLIHLSAASPWLATLVFHVVYALTTGAWRDLVPGRRDWRHLGGTLRHKLLLSEEMPMHGKYHILQKLLYLSFLPTILALAATGWAMTAPTSGSGSLLVRLVGGLQPARAAHYYLSLYLLTGATLHLYQTLIEPGVLVSMVTGWSAAVPPADTRAEKATRPPRLR
jgi:cytochrome b subunit of formate dehydrogenase